MGESFTIQISSNLVKQLTDDGEKSKKKTKRSKLRYHGNPNNPKLRRIRSRFLVILKYPNLLLRSVGPFSHQYSCPYPGLHILPVQS
ncbi:hypothetical protein CsSME_00044790 [Camellia sinensis var. sinensis]